MASRARCWMPASGLSVKSKSRNSPSATEEGAGDDEEQFRRSWPKAPMLARPPRADEVAGPGYGAVRAIDGRSARRTGRTAQFATVVSEEFKRWIKVQAAAKRQKHGGAARRYESRLYRKIRGGIEMLSLLKRKPKLPALIEQACGLLTHRGISPAEPAAKHQGQRGLLGCVRRACRRARHQQGGVVRGYGGRAAGDGAAARYEVAVRLKVRSGPCPPRRSLRAGCRSGAGSMKTRRLFTSHCRHHFSGSSSAEGRMPRPRLADGRRIWDVEELDLAFKALPREGGDDRAGIWPDRKRNGESMGRCAW